MYFSNHNMRHENKDLCVLHEKNYKWNENAHTNYKYKNGVTVKLTCGRRKLIFTCSVHPISINTDSQRNQAFYETLFIIFFQTITCLRIQGISQFYNTTNWSFLLPPFFYHAWINRITIRSWNLARKFARNYRNFVDKFVLEAAYRT